MTEEEQIRDRMKRELKEGDLVEVTLKEKAKVITGLFPVVILGHSEDSNNSDKSCVGYVKGIGEASIFLWQGKNILNSNNGVDVFYLAIAGYTKK